MTYFVSSCHTGAFARHTPKSAEVSFVVLTIGQSDGYAGVMTDITTSDTSQAPHGVSQHDSSGKTITPMQRRVLLGGSVGQFVEFYDLALYGIAAVSLSRLFFPSGSETAGLLMLFATYGVAFFIRPLGGLFFGALGDRIGRRNVLVATLLLIGLATTTIGLLPSFKTWGHLVYGPAGAFAVIARFFGRRGIRRCAVICF